jgi:pyruvate/2-oxoglutarate dehydrogenase complex dihydrolipoamide dehydrogenase (E3) component
MATDYDLVIVGGGSGGLVVASAAAQLKAKVALVEKERLGGDCLWYGCVPSKSLIHAARVAYQVKHSSRFGVYANAPEINFAEAHGYVEKIIATIAPHDSPQRFRGLGVEVIFGSGEFLDYHSFRVNGKILKARNYVIATGSRPAIPPIPGLSEAGYITNEQVFSLTSLPKTIAIIGTGPIGCELGQALHRLGAQVTLIGRASQILPKEEPEAAAVIEEQLLSEGVKILKATKVQKVELIEGKKHLLTDKEEVIVDEILVATGRMPNIESLNLKGAGVEYNFQGVKVNQKLQTTNPRIYACGDVIGGYRFTHVAGYEATVVLQNALFFPSKKADYRVIPWATFTEPELARVGLTEKEAREQYGDNIAILKQDFAGVDRALAEAAPTGFAKIITTRKGDILGAHIVGAAAGELIHEIVLAMSYRLKVSALKGIHVYPTLSEVNSKAGLGLTKQNYAQNKGLQSFLAKLFSLRRGLGW